MIKSISLKNFQSHKDTYIEFDPGVNVVIGENDSGKTAILRAINLIVNNKPSGEDFRSDWGGDTVVALDTDNKLVNRIRTDTKNIYALIHANGKEDVFKAFGQSVPDIIKQHLNMSLVNIAFQLEGPFLLGMSDADVAKHYNNAVNLDIIDRSISNIASILRKEKASLKVVKETEKKKLKELKEYDWLPDIEEKLINLEKLQNHINGIKNDWSILCGLIEEFKKLDKVNQELQKITKLEKDLLALINSKKEFDKLLEDYEELYLLVEKLNALDNEIEGLNQIIQYQDKVNLLIKKSNEIKEEGLIESDLAKHIDLLKGYKEAEKRYKSIVKYTPDISALLDLSNDIDKDIQRYNNLQELIDNWLLFDKKYNDLGYKLEKLEIRFKESMPEKCPIFDVPCKHIN